MTDKVLGIKKEEVNEAIRLIKEKESKAGNSLSIISEREVLKELRKVFEDMRKDSVPVVSVEWLENYCKKNNFASMKMEETKNAKQLKIAKKIDKDFTAYKRVHNCKCVHVKELLSTARKEASNE